MSSRADNEPEPWWVVYTKPRQEFRALEQLENQSYTCFLPTLHIKTRRHGKATLFVEPLFPRYLFLQLNEAARRWEPIRSTRGVSHPVSFGGCFATVPVEFIEGLQRAEQTIHHPLFSHGQRVMISDGPFSGFEGTYEMPGGEGRALVLMELLSQPQRLKFAIEMLKAL